jgi:hypothetical protein
MVLGADGVDFGQPRIVVRDGGEHMKYVLLFCGTAEDQREYDSLKSEDFQQRMGQVMQWFGQHQDKLRGGHQLQGPDTATTVRFGGNGKPLVKDGLFLEGKEIVGGYAEVEVADLDEALAMAKTWPGGGTVEIRPVVGR